MTDPPGGVLWPVCANPVADDDGAVESPFDEGVVMATATPGGPTS